MAETLLRALRVATAGVPGPVVISVPEDVLTASVTAPPVAPQAAPRAAPDPADLADLSGWLGEAERPLVLAGSSLDRPGGREALLAFLNSWQIPALVSFRRQDLLPNTHPLYAGDMGLSNPEAQISALREADLLLVVGARLSDITTQGYSYPCLVRPQMRLAHVHPDPGVVGTHFAADLAMACDPIAVLSALGAPPSPPTLAREAWIERLAAQRPQHRGRPCRRGG